MKWPWLSGEPEWEPRPRAPWDEDNWCLYCSCLVGGHPDHPQYDTTETHGPECPYAAQDYAGPNRRQAADINTPLLIAILAELRAVREQRALDRELGRPW